MLYSLLAFVILAASSLVAWSAEEVLSVDQGVSLTCRLAGPTQTLPWKQIPVRQTDCEFPDVPCNVSHVSLFTVDEANQRVYLLVTTTGASFDPPAMIQRWSFRSQRIERIAAAPRAMGNLAPSPDRKLVAYIGIYKAGAMKARYSIEVIALETGEQATLRGWEQGVLEIIDEIEWSGPLTIRYKGTDGTEPEAMKGGYDESKRFPISRTLNLEEAKWSKH